VALEQVIRLWFRQLAHDFHPDHRGGSSEAMLAINEAHHRLRKAFKL
jgi:DnaJ-class molecular chaperone